MNQMIPNLSGAAPTTLTTRFGNMRSKFSQGFNEFTVVKNTL